MVFRNAPRKLGVDSSSGGSMVTVAELLPGDPPRLGAYRILGRLGAGGQAVVYLAAGPADEQVAIKVLNGQRPVDERAREALIRESQAARQVAGFCTARVLQIEV